MAEAFRMHLEVHGGGVGNLHVLESMVSPGLYYERGLLHPFIDGDEPPAWLNKAVDPMDDEGFIHISPDRGIGYGIYWAYINANTVADRPSRSSGMSGASRWPARGSRFQAHVFP